VLVNRIWLALVLGACTIDMPDLDGLACPCVAGYTCDETTMRCVRASPGCEDTGAVTVADLHAEWEGSRMIFWGWERAGDATMLSQHILFVGENEEDVRRAACGENVVGVERYDSSRNPELGQAFLRDTSGTDPVALTQADGLEDGRLYYAQLVVFDTMNRTQRSNIAQKQTLAEPNQHVDLILDAASGPFTDCIAYSDDPAFESPFAHEHAHPGSWQSSHYCNGGEAVCAPVEPHGIECWENVRWTAPTAERLTLSEGQFNQACLEFALRIDNPDHLDWADVSIEFGGPHFGRQPITFRADGAYRLYQVKLGAFRSSEGAPLAHADVYDQPITLFWVGGVLAHEVGVLRVDAVRFRW
jgi:hypothetical protein